jgi:DNA polymerase family A
MIRPDALDCFGLLSEAVQVKASIFFADSERRGMGLDLTRLGTIQANLVRRRDEQVALLVAMPRCEDLFNRDRNGVIRLTPKGGAPSLSQKRLRSLLEAVAKALAAEAGRPVLIPRTAKGKVSLAAEDWEKLAPFDSLVAAWIELGKTTKSLQFFRSLDGATVHPHYTTLVRTGRTSCSAPNIQNLPRKGGFREAFVARKGYLLLIVDYSYIELRTLAAEFLARYGSSRLADVIREGLDPHCFTAAMFEGMELADFLELGRSDVAEERERYSTLRQRAKVLNFGIPGGLGPVSLVAYARSTYGVTLTLEQATEFRNRLIHEVYPELGTYLADDAMESLARNLGTSAEACWRRFDRSGQRSGQIAGAVKKVVQGNPQRADGTPYKPVFVKGVWEGLIALNRNPDLTPLVASRQGSEALRARLFDSAVTTLTGRIRGRVRFTQAKNTPFQGLAADGAKLAIWDLMRAGYRVVAFIHDEVVIEIPEDADHAAEARRVESIMNRAMEVVTGEVPVAVEYALSRRWSKQAKAVFDAEGRLLPYEIDPT